MKPIESIEYLLRFAGPLSPWWLALLVPAASLAAWALYRVQFAGLRRGHAAALLFLRIAAVGLLVGLVCRPSVVRRKTLTYDGRIVVLVDDSASMAASDNALTDAEALHLYRRLWQRLAEDAPYHRLALTVERIAADVQRFERFSRGADRSGDAFWQRAAEAQGRLDEAFDRLVQQLGAASPIAGRDPNAPRRRRDARDLHGRTKEFFEGSAQVAPEAFARFDKAADDLTRRLLALQGRKDEADIAAGNAALREAADEIRRRPRIELLARELSRLGAAIEQLTGQRQFLRFVSVLAGGDRGPEQFRPAELRTKAGTTDLVGAVERIAAAGSDFPLAAILVAGDARDLSGRPLGPLTQALSQKQVPVYVAGVGSPREPIDVSILAVSAPPLAARGAPVDVRVVLKTSLDRTFAGSLQVLRGTEPVASQQIELGGAETAVAAVRFAPAEAGLFPYTVRVAPAPGETFPRRNNAADFVLNVRPDKARVLLLDWKPRWETRFALNILQRLDYVELNALIVLARPGATLKRGVARGAYPESLAALEMYDLVILGDVPPDTLTPREWGDLRSIVEEKGKTLCLLAPTAATKDGLPGGLFDILPAEPPDRAAGAGRDTDGSVEQLRLTDAGRVHPITRRLAPRVQRTQRVRPGRTRGEAQVLLAGTGGEPLLTARLIGSGKTLLLGTDRLWKALNPTALAAHREVYVSMLNWALEGGYVDGADPAAARLAVDRRTFTTREPVQVWLSGAPAGTVVEALAGEDVVAQAPAGPTGCGSPLLRAPLGLLPAGEVIFRLEGRPEVRSPAVRIVEDNPELKVLARDDRFGRELAESTGGGFRDFVHLQRLLMRVKPKQNVRREEAVWRMWDAATILAAILCLLTVEWVYRKLVGLV